MIVALPLVGASAAEAVKPLIRAHSHNDYMHDRPLLDALDCGFCSVEADIHLVDGKLLVAHDADQCKPENTLERLYLDPLRERAKANGGRIYANGPVVTLLIDLKTGAEDTYAALDKVLERYADIFTEFRGDQVTERAVTALISGNRPVRTMANQDVRYAALDGRPPDLEGDLPATLVPLVSSDWNSLFTWRGRDDMPETDLAKLREFVGKAHAQGRRVRFWSLPWTPKIWTILYDEGVDLINADNLPGLRAFLLDRATSNP